MTDKIKDSIKKTLHYLKDPRNILYYFLAWLIIYSPFIILLVFSNLTHISSAYAWTYFAFIINPLTPFWIVAIALAIALKKLLEIKK